MIFVVSELDLPPSKAVRVDGPEGLAASLPHDEGDDVLVLADAGVRHHVAKVVKALVLRRGVIVVGVDGHDTARTIAFTALSTLDPASYGRASEVLRRLQEEIRTNLAMTGVTRLSEPAPRMSDHVRSWWPPSRFAVDLRSKTITATPSPSLPNESGTYVVRAVHDPKGTLRLQQLSAADHEISPETRPSWASRRWAEQSSAPGNLAAMVAGILDGLDSQHCPECGCRSAQARCPSCGTLLHDPGGRPLRGRTDGRVSEDAAPGTIDSTQNGTQR